MELYFIYTSIIFTIITVLAIIVMTMASNKRTNLKMWLWAYYSQLIPQVFVFLMELQKIKLIKISRDLLVLIPSIVIFIVVIIQYRQKFRLKKIPDVIFAAAPIPFIVIAPLAIFVIIILWTSTYLLIRIYRMEKTPTNLFLAILLAIAGAQGIYTIIQSGFRDPTTGQEIQDIFVAILVWIPSCHCNCSMDGN